MKEVCLLLVILMASSCAEPRYVDPHDQSISGVSGECELFFPKEDLCLRALWDVKPTESTFGSMTLHFHHRDDPRQLVTPLKTPAIVLWMPSMGHGSSPVTLTFLEKGTFKATDIFFIMPGPWDIRYQLKDGSHVVEETIQKITL